MPDPAPTTLTGGCRCGAIRYAVSRSAMFTVTCHCRTCQYECGGGPAHGIVVPEHDLAIVQGAPRRFVHRGGSDRAVFRSFCPDCGTPLFGGNAEGGGFASVKAGSLDDPAVFRPQLAIWTESAPPWHRVDPDIPSFARNPPAD